MLLYYIIININIFLENILKNVKLEKKEKWK